MAVTDRPDPSLQDDPESADALPLEDGPVASTPDADRLDVTPRTGPGSAPTGRSGSRTRTYVAVGAVAVIVIGLGLVLFNGLRDASTFFYNVDEVAAQRDSLQGQRIRVQGNVVDGSVRRTDDGVAFVLRFKGEEIPVQHVGDPPELFGPKIPVVLEGELDGDTFRSDTILIRHDASYDEENEDRVREAERDAEQTGASTTTAPGADEEGPALGGASG
ncbi:cytochrome c maturation protein CcmE [Dermatobacter hominis]|uniref:cytochrome c maturation protein CcmE n=1 Tax=Dermatobacter hominis TaxID=2884263 RepID=UPI001D0FAAEE|nr:cytochrome c maturation protein CcmE [Dermatobacter hominis]UDY37285.1 cytochrome c maturation protein CcmE [Dermatobacter hominis]